MAKKKVEKLEVTISRKRWLRGDDDARLRTTDGKQCCMGFICRALGASIADILEQSYPSDAKDHAKDQASASKFAPQWLIMDEKRISLVNDDSDLTTVEREAKLIKLTENRPIKLKFVP